MSCGPPVWLSLRLLKRSKGLARQRLGGHQTFENASGYWAGRNLSGPVSGWDQLLGSLLSRAVSWVICAVWLVMIDWASFLASGFCPADCSVVAMLTAP